LEPITIALTNTLLSSFPPLFSFSFLFLFLFLFSLSLLSFLFSVFSFLFPLSLLSSLTSLFLFYFLVIFVAKMTHFVTGPFPEIYHECGSYGEFRETFKSFRVSVGFLKEPSENLEKSEKKAGSAELKALAAEKKARAARQKALTAELERGSAELKALVAELKALAVEKKARAAELKAHLPFLRQASLVRLVANFEGFVQDVLADTARIYFANDTAARENFMYRNKGSDINTLIVKKVMALANPTFGSIREWCKTNLDVVEIFPEFLFQRTIIKLKTSNLDIQIRRGKRIQLEKCEILRVDECEVLGLLVLFFYGIRCVLAHGNEEKTLSQGALLKFKTDFKTKLNSSPEELVSWFENTFNDVVASGPKFDVDNIVLFNCNRVLGLAALALKTALGVLLAQKLDRKVWNCDRATPIPEFE